jgi:nucleotide-binding universal stress UspA family protein
MADLILVPTDFEQASRDALDLAKRLAGSLGATIVLAHVAPILPYMYPGLDPTLVQPFGEEVAAAAKRALEQLGIQAGGIKTVLRQGDAATEILDLANELGASMIAMGTHGRRGLAHLLLGSVAEKVVRQASIPVLTVRSP